MGKKCAKPSSQPLHSIILFLETGRFIFLLGVYIKISAKCRVLQAWGYHGHYHPFLTLLESRYFVQIIHSQAILLFLTSVSKADKRVPFHLVQRIPQRSKIDKSEFFFFLPSGKVHNINYHSCVSLGEVLLQHSHTRRLDVRKGIFWHSLKAE